MSIKTKLTVSEIQRFCMHDGPGIRTTVFLKGCPLHCEWCHNPETQKFSPELLYYGGRCIGCFSCADVCPNGVHRGESEHIIDRSNCTACALCANACPSTALELCGKEMTFADILSIAEKDKSFYGKTGGITLSGGEPFAQSEATVEFLKACRTQRISTAVETCGYCDTDILLSAIPFVDLFLWDIKDTNPVRHKKYTGASNELILKNLNAANEKNARIRLRCILVNGVNTDEEHYKSIARLATGINNFDGIDILPYHAYGGSKALLLGLRDNGKKEWIPDHSQIDRLNSILRDHGIIV